MVERRLYMADMGVQFSNKVPNNVLKAVDANWQQCLVCLIVSSVGARKDDDEVLVNWIDSGLSAV